MSTIRTNNIVDAGGGNTATINGITPALASQAEAQAGTDNTKLMTPLRVGEHMSANGAFSGGYSVTSYTTSQRVLATAYQNTTGRPLMVHVTARSVANNFSRFQISPDNSTWTELGMTVASTWTSAWNSIHIIVPPGWYYRYTEGTPNGNIVEIAG